MVHMFVFSVFSIHRSDLFFFEWYKEPGVFCLSVFDRSVGQHHIHFFKESGKEYKPLFLVQSSKKVSVNQPKTVDKFHR